MALIYTQLAQDNFQRGNVNPLSQNKNWTSLPLPQLLKF